MQEHTPDGSRVEPVSRPIEGASANELINFWTAHGALDRQAARDRLAEVLCVLRSADGRLTAVNSAHPREIAAIGGRRLWSYRTFAPEPLAPEASQTMLAGAAEALEREHRATSSSPEGLYAEISDRRWVDRYPQALWDQSGMLLAGYTQVGAQRRVTWFSPGGPPRPIEGRHEIVPPTELGPNWEREIRAMWARAGAIASEQEAQRRLSEVCGVAVDAAGAVGGVSTTRVIEVPALRLPLHYIRVFIDPDHRRHSLGRHFLLHARDHHHHRWRNGEDSGVPGVFFVLQNRQVQATQRRGRWESTGFSYIGDDPHGNHKRVYYFPGAQIPG